MREAVCAIAVLLVVSASAANGQPPLRELPEQLLTNVWHDQKPIWTSPFHLDHARTLKWLGFTALAATLVATDRRTEHLLPNTKGQVSAGNSISKLGATYTLIPEAAGLYFYGLAGHDRRAQETGFLGGEALADAALVVEVLKFAARRNRPNAATRPGDFFQGGASFPSGHSIATFALASVVAREYGKQHKWVPWLAYGVAGVVGAARFTGRQHYASDVLAGGAMGFFIGEFVFDTRAH
jgi:hypothetical protein